MMSRSDAEKYYDDVIAPKLAALAKDARDHHINFLALVEYERQESPGGTETAHTVGIDFPTGSAFLLALNAVRCAGNIDALGMWLYRYAKDIPEDKNQSVFLRLILKSGPR
jgi:hypothetical protein